MVAYYNEFDPQAAEWLRILILQGNIAPGVVDERSIEDVRPEELKQYTQCHFFAGIGGWSYALRLAGWPDDRPCWTGSPPCQPFSNAGKQTAQADSRHLWPVFFNLIRECKPANIFGEQVEAAIRTGWLDDLQDDLEAEGYATGKIVLPACSVGGYHIRQRIWFVAEWLADSIDERSQGRLSGGSDAEWKNINGHLGCGRSDYRLAKPDQQQWNGSGNAGEARRREFANIGAGSRLANANCEQNNTADSRGLHTEPCSESRDGGLDNSTQQRPQRGGTNINGRGGSIANGQHNKSAGADNFSAISTTNAPETFWSNPDWLYCRDGKWRPVESGTFPLANGVSGRVGLLRGYGNAIVPQVAAQVIKAYMDG